MPSALRLSNDEGVSTLSVKWKYAVASVKPVDAIKRICSVLEFNLNCSYAVRFILEMVKIRASNRVSLIFLA